MNTPVKIVSIEISGLANTGKTAILKEINDLLKEKGFSIHLTNEEDIRDMENMKSSDYNQENILNKVSKEIIINLHTSQTKLPYHV